MVTSPNWMAPFHIARATADPRAVVCTGSSVRRAWPGRTDRVRTIARTGNHSASRRAAGASPEDDERVQVDPARAVRTQLDRVRPEGREARRVHDDPLAVAARLEADRRLECAVDIDACRAAGRARLTGDRDRTAAERGLRTGAGLLRPHPRAVGRIRRGH